MTDSDSYKSAFEYLYRSESTKDLPIQHQVIARVAKLMEEREALLELVVRAKAVLPNYQKELHLAIDKHLSSVEGK